MGQVENLNTSAIVTNPAIRSVSRSVFPDRRTDPDGFARAQILYAERLLYYTDEPILLEQDLTSPVLTWARKYYPPRYFGEMAVRLRSMKAEFLQQHPLTDDPKGWLNIFENDTWREYLPPNVIPPEPST